MARQQPTIVFPEFHEAQKEVYRGLSRRTVLRCGRRWGKTTLLESVAGDTAIKQAIKGKKVGWFAPSYKLNSPSYDRIVRMIRPMVEHKNKTDMLIETPNGGCIEFWTLGDEDAGRSRSYDGVIIDEGSLVKKGLKDTWQKAISPTLLDRRGWAIMAGTPKGIDPDNFFYEACMTAKMASEGQKVEVWKEFHMPTWLNPMLDPEGVAKLVDEYPPLVYQQEFKADFVDWTGAAFFSLEAMQVDNLPVAWPAHCDAVFATIDTATKTGKKNDGTAVCFWAINKFHGHPLTLLDWDIIQIEGAILETWLPSIFIRLEEMAAMCGARRGSLGAWIEDKSSGMVLLQQARNRNWPAHPIDSGLTAVGKDERAISVSGYVYRGWVKISDKAFHKTVVYKTQTRNHFISQFFGYRVGQEEEADDLLDAACYGIAIALGDEEGF